MQSLYANFGSRGSYLGHGLTMWHSVITHFRILRDVITYTRLRYMLLANNFSYNAVKWPDVPELWTDSRPVLSCLEECVISSVVYCVKELDDSEWWKNNKAPCGTKR